MKNRILSVIVLLLTSYLSIFACNSDCRMCHMNIPKDTNHEPIGNCMNCHKNHKLDVVNQCGADCFDCHSYKKVMAITKEHKVIKKCSDCHINLKGKNTEDLPLIFDKKPSFNSPFNLK